MQNMVLLLIVLQALIFSVYCFGNKKEIGYGQYLTLCCLANCAINCGASVFVHDIDKNTWNISIEELEKKLAVSKKKKKLPKLLIPVHFAGQPTEQKKNLGIIKKIQI